MDWVKKHFKPLFFLLFGMLVLLGNKMQSDRQLLMTASAPYGILNLQLSNSFKADTAIRGEWQRKKVTRLVYLSDSTTNETFTGLCFAQNQTRYDFGFALLYILFLSLLLFKLDQYIFLSGLGIALVVLAGLLNMLVDAQELALYAGHSFSVSLIYYPSVIKWLSLILVVVYLLIRVIWLGLLRVGLQRIAIYLHFIARQSLRFRIVISGLLVIFALLWAVDQGQDLLLTINYSRPGAALFMAALSIWAVLNWYLPKLYDLPSPGEPLKITRLLKNEGGEKISRPKKHFARILGAATFLIPAVCLLEVMRNFHIRYWLQDIQPILFLPVALLFYHHTAKHKWIEKCYKKDTGLKISITLALILALMSYWGFGTGNDAKPYYLAFLSLDLFLLSFVFVLITTLRIELSKMVRLAWLADQRINWFVWLPGLCCFLMFLYCNIFPLQLAFNSNARFLTLPVVIVALIFYNILFSVLLLAGQKFKMQLISIIFIAGLCISIIPGSFHNVRLVSHPVRVRAYDSLTDYSAAWLKKRSADIIAFHQRFPADTFPVFIVNTYGGGIRASAWTGFVIDRLDSLLKAADHSPRYAMLNHDFQHYVFAYSGASGGTIGASVLCAARSSHQEASLMAHDLDYYANDFLTPVMTGLLGRDIWAAGSGVRFYKDREGLQEDTWQIHSASYGVSYGDTLSNYWRDKQYEVPLLFSNTFDEERGTKGIAAPIKLKPADFPGAVVVEDLIQRPNDEMRLSTTAFLSARFPFVSPTGKLQDQHFSDGGNVENSGAETARQVSHVFQGMLTLLAQKAPGIYGRVKIVIISLPNSLKGAADEGQAKSWFELGAPLIGLLNTIDGNAYKEDLVNRLGATTGVYNYYQVAPTLPLHSVNGGWPVYPLGWQISNDALVQMKRSLDQNKAIGSVFNSLRPLVLKK